MRRDANCKNRHALVALTLAGISTISGAAARGDFQVSVTAVQLNEAYQGNFWDVYVLAATNDGSNGTGSMLASAEVVLDNGGPSTFSSEAGAFGIDIEKIIGTGSNTKYSANVGGGIALGFGQNSINNQNNRAAPEFGDVVGGTFIGIGTGRFTTDLANNPQTTTDGANGSSSGTIAVFANGLTDTYTTTGNVGTQLTTGFLNKAPQLDNVFENGSNPNAAVHAGNVLNALLNGKVHSLQVDTVATDAAGNLKPVPDDVANGPVPFANIVVPHGTSGTFHGVLAGETGNGSTFPGPPPPPVGTMAIKLTGTGTTLGANIGTATVVGSNGNYAPATATPIGGQQTTANLTIAGFNPAQRSADRRHRRGRRHFAGDPARGSPEFSSGHQSRRDGVRSLRFSGGNSHCQWRQCRNSVPKCSDSERESGSVLV